MGTAKTAGDVETTTLVLLVLSCAFVAQDVSPPSSSLRFKFFLPQDARSEAVQIRYFTTGPSGAYRGFIKQQAGLKSYDFAAPGTKVKVIAYIPGCEIDTLDLSAGMSTTQPLECRPLASVQLAGQIIPANVLVCKAPVVEVTYLAFWAHDFFGIADGMVTTFQVATATPDDDGVFKMSLPDFAQDAVSARSKQGAEWRFLLREVGTGNVFATLKPMESKGNISGLAVRSSYPDVVNFVAVRN